MSRRPCAGMRPGEVVSLFFVGPGRIRSPSFQDEPSGYHKRRRAEGAGRRDPPSARPFPKNTAKSPWPPRLTADWWTWPRPWPSLTAEADPSPSSLFWRTLRRGSTSCATPPPTSWPRRSRSLFPGTKVAIGPAVADGFYYDFEVETPFTPEDLPRIEAKMAEIIKADKPFARSVLKTSEAKDRFSAESEDYKVELISDLETNAGAETVSLYNQGGFTDLCRGPHLPSTGRVRAYKLTHVAGAYWARRRAQQDAPADLRNRLFRQKGAQGPPEEPGGGQEGGTTASWARSWTSSPSTTRSARAWSSGTPRGPGFGPCWRRPSGAGTWAGATRW